MPGCCTSNQAKIPPAWTRPRTAQAESRESNHRAPSRRRCRVRTASVFSRVSYRLRPCFITLSPFTDTRTRNISKDISVLTPRKNLLCVKYVQKHLHEATCSFGTSASSIPERRKIIQVASPTSEENPPFVAPRSPLRMRRTKAMGQRHHPLCLIRWMSHTRLCKTLLHHILHMKVAA